LLDSSIDSSIDSSSDLARERVTESKMLVARRIYGRQTWCIESSRLQSRVEIKEPLDLSAHRLFATTRSAWRAEGLQLAAIQHRLLCWREGENPSDLRHMIAAKVGRSLATQPLVDQRPLYV
jgi:hypothetical protein